MNELINVKNENGELLVSARELHKGLGIKTQYTKWIDRMFEYGFEENIDYITISQKRLTAQGNETTYVDHILKLDCAKEISMIQRSEKGKQIRRYFIERAKVWIKEQEEKQKLLLEIEEQKPKVEYHDTVLKSQKLISTTDVAKDLGMSARKLNEKLNELKVIYKQSNTWKLYSKHQDKVPEYCDYHINEFGQILKWTEKGRKWIIELLSK